MWTRLCQPLSSNTMSLSPVPTALPVSNDELTKKPMMPTSSSVAPNASAYTCAGVMVRVSFTRVLLGSLVPPPRRHECPADGEEGRDEHERLEDGTEVGGHSSGALPRRPPDEPLHGRRRATYERSSVIGSPS